jgi:radical SAM superfamily enzyme YgiQ (UPF0313 family)
MPKLLLIQPSQYSSTGKLIKQKKIYLPGLVFPLLAAMMPENWEVEVRLEVVEDIDFNTDADLVGIGAMGHALIRAFELAEAFRKNGRIVFLGGYMASMVPEYALNFVDSVVVGDAEKSFPHLLHDFERTGKIKKIYNEPIENLVGLPVPKYEVLTGKPIGDMLPVQAGRGCPHGCSFCSIACLYKGKYFVRPVEEVIRDIQKIKSLGFRKFYLIDDNIAGDLAYLKELARRVKPLHMAWATQSTLNLARDRELLALLADSGCQVLSLGIESISQEGLDTLNKKWLKVDEHESLIRNFRKAGIMVSAEMIVGTDGDTVDSIKATYKFIMKTRLPLLRIYILTPVIGSPFWDRLFKEGRIIREEHQYYDAAHCVHVPGKISPEDLERTYRWINLKVFSLKSIFLRTIFTIDFIKNPVRYLFAFFVNLHYRSSVIRGDTPVIL